VFGTVDSFLRTLSVV